MLILWDMMGGWNLTKLDFLTHLEQWGLWKALAASDSFIYASRSYLRNYFPPHYTFLHVLQLRDLEKEVESMLSGSVFQIHWMILLRPRDLFCGVLLHFHHYSDVSKWSSYSTFIVMLSRAPLCQRQYSLAVYLPLLPFCSNLTYCIVYRSVYILKFSLWLPSIVQLHCAGYNYALSPTFFGRPLQPRGGGRGGGNGVSGPRGFGFLSVRIWVLEPYNYHSLTTPSKAKTDLYLWWSKWMTQRRDLAEYSLPATSTIPPLTTSPCSWSELGLYSFPLDLPRMVL